MTIQGYAEIEMKHTPAFHVSARNQGQIVEIAHAACYGNVVRRITDQSIGTGRPSRVEYAVATMMADDEGDYWQTEPANRRWRKISEAEAQRYLNGETEVAR
jgi:hypothetical protein